MSNKSGISEQFLSRPKGGGAVKGIGEKFSPDPFTGVRNFNVSLDMPLSRNGFQPRLSLVYSAGNSNGFFCQGWGLSIPGVSRNPSNPGQKGKDDPAVVGWNGADPFAWKLTETLTLFGNRMVYEYEVDELDDGTYNWKRLQLRVSSMRNLRIKARSDFLFSPFCLGRPGRFRDLHDQAPYVHSNPAQL